MVYRSQENKGLTVRKDSYTGKTGHVGVNEISYSSLA